MRDYIEDRIIRTAQYIVENGATVREAANVCHISKSTVHKDVSERLQLIDKRLAAQVRAVLDVNKAERHIRGGMATCQKYKSRKDAASSC